MAQATLSDERLTLTVEECARALGIGRNTCFEQIHAGVIPSLRLGRRLVVPKAGLERLLQEAADGTE